MDGLSSAASVIAGIQLAGSIANLCARYIQEVKDAPDDIITLQRTISGLEAVFQRLNGLLEDPRGAKLPTSSSVVNNLSDCLSHLEALKQKIDLGRGKRAMRRLGIRALQWPLKRTEVERIIHDLERYKSTFTLSLQVDQTALLTSVDQTLGLGKLPIARGAEFGSYMDQHEDECLPGTRIELLRQITEWSRSPCGKCMFWLNGMAGTGKSTISRTFAKSLKESKLLGASFFFKRGEVDRGNAAKLFPTLTRQLVASIPLLIPAIQEAVNSDPGIITKSLKEQFDKLLFQPLQNLKHSNYPTPVLVVVIDALDECEADDDIRVILQLLPQLRVPSGGRLRIFLTSRPELPIRLGFSELAAQDYQGLVLHEIPEAVTEHDISLFLEHRLSKIREDRSLPFDWPGKANVQALVRLSVPLFIFASTVCRILEDPQWDPMDSLSEVLSHRTEGSRLAGTYLPVLNRLLNNQSGKKKEKLIHEYHDVIGAIVTLESPLSVISLSRLIGLSEGVISLRLNSLHSVLSIPKDKAAPVRLLHLSFRDFVLDPETGNKTPFWVDESEMHRKLTARCFIVLHGLRRNICGLSYGTQRTEIDQPIIERCIPPELRYSCYFWAQHLVRSNDQRHLIYDAFSFLRRHFLHWMEAMSILGLVSEVVKLIGLVQSAVYGDKHVEISEFLHDATRFVLRNRQIADDAPLQLYCSCLLFAPRTAIIRRQFERELLSCISALPKVQETWSADLQTLEGHSGCVWGVAFSPSGRLLASSSSDHTVRLWDPATGTLHQTLKGHSDWVRSVAFSSDGRLLASGSYDLTVKIWDVIACTLLQTLEGHSDSIYSVVFSPDNRQLASGSGDGTVRLCDPASGVVYQTFRGHLDSVYSVAFSPDNRQLASGSGDGTVRVWDPNAGLLQRTLEGHLRSVYSVTFSPDGRLLASCSNDMTVIVWDSTTGALYRILEGHSDWVRSVAFSPDGCLLVSGSYDKTVRIWDCATGRMNQMLKGHSGLVCFLAFSPDGQLLASGSSDRTVRIWSVSSDPKNEAHESHSGPVRSMAFSPDGRLLASGSDDGTVRLWDPATGVLHQTSNVSGVATKLEFSADSARLNTNLGSFDIEPCSTKHDSTPVANVEILMQNDQWINVNGGKTLWLPPDYRPTCSAVNGSILALGHASGMVSFIGFNGY